MSHRRFVDTALSHGVKKTKTKGKSACPAAIMLSECLYTGPDLIEALSAGPTSQLLTQQCHTVSREGCMWAHPDLSGALCAAATGRVST